MPTIFQSFWDDFLGLTRSKQNGWGVLLKDIKITCVCLFVLV